MHFQHNYSSLQIFVKIMIYVYNNYFFNIVKIFIALLINLMHPCWIYIEYICIYIYIYIFIYTQYILNIYNIDILLIKIKIKVK